MNLQQRHFDYVLGPNQDARLASVSPGTVLEEVLLHLDDDAPFVLTSRSVRHAYDSDLIQDMQGLKTKWTGPTRDYRQQGYVRESLQMANYGQFGNHKPIVPGIHFPPRSVLMLDLINGGSNTLTNLTFYFHGFKLFPSGAVPAYTYPRKFSSQTFAYPVPVVALGVSEFRQNQIFTVKEDADFVIRGGQGITISSENGRVLAEVSIRLKDFNKNPYSNDLVPFDILFGCGGFPAVIPVGPTPDFVAPFPTGPGLPGLFYPEIYVPKNHQLLYDLQRADGAGGSNQAEDFVFSFLGGKAFNK